MKAPHQPIERRFSELLATSRIYHREWVDRSAAALAELEQLRRRAQRLHRRAQQAEAQALREGRRADRMAAQLRLMLRPKLLTTADHGSL